MSDGRKSLTTALTYDHLSCVRLSQFSSPTLHSSCVYTHDTPPSESLCAKGKSLKRLYCVCAGDESLSRSAVHACDAVFHEGGVLDVDGGR